MPANQVGTQTAVDTAACVARSIVELQRAVNKIGMYPPDHPLVPAAIERLQQSLEETLSRSSRLRLGISKEKILFEGEPIDDRSPAVKWVARALHEAGVVALELSSRARGGDLFRLINWFARTRRTGDQAATGEELAGAGIGGVQVELVDYGRLAFTEEVSDEPRDVWDSLAKALMSELPGGGAFLDADALSELFTEHGMRPDKLAARVEGSAADRKRISARLALAGGMLGELPEAERRKVRERIGAFLSHVSTDMRSELLRVAPTLGEGGTRLLVEMVGVLPDEQLVQALEDVQRSGDKIPHQLMALFGKITELRDGSPASDGKTASSMMEGEAVKEVFREVFTDRSGTEHNPEAYQELLEKISSRPSGALVEIDVDPRYRSPNDREDLRAAASAIAARLVLEDPSGEEVPALLECIASSAGEMLAAGRYEELVMAIAAVRQIGASQEAGEEQRRLAGELLERVLDEAAIRKIIEGCQSAPEDALPPLHRLFSMTGPGGVSKALETVPTLRAGPARERLIQLLSVCEPEDLVEGFTTISAVSVDALKGVLPLLRRVDAKEAIPVAQKLTSHDDADVRIEAFRALASADRREGAFERCLEAALWDPDPKVGKFALGMIEGRGNERSCDILSRFIAGEIGARNEKLQLRAVGALAKIPGRAARDALIGFLLAGRLSFRSADLRLRVAAERALVRRDDEHSRQALRSWRSSLAYWVSLLVVKRQA